jgi:hypothetical protein
MKNYGSYIPIIKDKVSGLFCLGLENFLMAKTKLRRIGRGGHHEKIGL